jgi:hypothetical protein
LFDSLCLNVNVQNLKTVIFPETHISFPRQGMLLELVKLFMRTACRVKKVVATMLVTVCWGSLLMPWIFRHEKQRPCPYARRIIFSATAGFVERRRAALGYTGIGKASHGPVDKAIRQEIVRLESTTSRPLERNGADQGRLQRTRQWRADQAGLDSACPSPCPSPLPILSCLGQRDRADKRIHSPQRRVFAQARV